MLTELEKAKSELKEALKRVADLMPKQELKHIDFDSGIIPVGNKILKINTSVSVDKFVPLEVLQRTFAFGKDIAAIEADLSLAYTFLDNQKLADSAVVIHNLKESIVRNLEDRIPSALELCFLYLTYEDEDCTRYNPELNKQKLEDIRREGYDVNDFFTLAANLCTGYIQSFEKISRTISKELQKDLNITGKLK